MRCFYSQSDFGTWLYWLEYHFNSTGTEKRIKMTHVCPTLNLNPGSLQKIFNISLNHESYTWQITMERLRNGTGQCIITGKSINRAI
jgi:hypothetical protein